MFKKLANEECACWGCLQSHELFIRLWRDLELACFLRVAGGTLDKPRWKYPTSHLAFRPMTAKTGKRISASRQLEYMRLPEDPFGASPAASQQQKREFSLQDQLPLEENEEKGLADSHVTLSDTISPTREGGLREPQAFYIRKKRRRQRLDPCAAILARHLYAEDLPGMVVFPSEPQRVISNATDVFLSPRKSLTQQAPKVESKSFAQDTTYTTSTYEQAADIDSVGVQCSAFVIRTEGLVLEPSQGPTAAPLKRLKLLEETSKAFPPGSQGGPSNLTDEDVLRLRKEDTGSFEEAKKDKEQTGHLLKSEASKERVTRVRSS